jgi:hypothetical protein
MGKLATQFVILHGMCSATISTQGNFVFGLFIPDAKKRERLLIK